MCFSSGGGAQTVKALPKPAEVADEIPAPDAPASIDTTSQTSSPATVRTTSGGTGLNIPTV